ncbi:hypothetical protein PR202_ga05611 [Eleusine coracana subsp. coracana]|uniref:Jacalin-type lectin domain-containing protein n=1 Tax=Eleusine coracana subsp. coracana TaxID=191504 RepID=A0AAV5BTV4_ELECO|nr:hypothetical protein PR202_ga05157 [Eleusine coracana subsp. coracana]GJM89417.1 hypothetical protein PR202_ga05611 [Eleusine coracana subsp. coracana]
MAAARAGFGGGPVAAVFPLHVEEIDANVGPAVPPCAVAELKTPVEALELKMRRDGRNEVFQQWELPEDESEEDEEEESLSLLKKLQRGVPGGRIKGFNQELPNPVVFPICYSAVKRAVEATIQINVSREFSIEFGKISALITGIEKEVVLFDSDASGTIKISDDRIELCRSVVSVPIDGSLLLRVDTWEGNCKAKLSGSATIFTPQLCGEDVATVHPAIQVKSFKTINGKSPIVVGPWGGTGGYPWDDGVYSTIRQIVITHGAAIDSIRIEYDLKGSSIWSDTHGGTDGGSDTDKVKLDFPDEALVSVSGHYGSVCGTPVIIRSLTFQSNRSKYGPFGTEEGTPFSLPVSSGKMVLDMTTWPSLCGTEVTVTAFMVAISSSSSIRVHPQSTTMELYRIRWFLSLVTMEIKELQLALRCMAPGVEVVVPFDDGMYTGVWQINLTRAVGISSMKVLYDRNGQAVWGNKHGFSGGVPPDKIVFDFPSEVLTHITGFYGSAIIMGPTVIRSLTFHTNKRTYGPYGDEYGTYFSTNFTNGRIVGFHGREGWYIDGIGVHVQEGKVTSQRYISRPRTTMSPSLHYNMSTQAQNDSDDEVAYGMVKEPIPMGPGPWGGEGGRPWDDGVYTGVKQIYIMRGAFIGSIQIEYDRGGHSIWSARHGNSGHMTHRVKLDYPHEVLTCVYGYYNTNPGEGPRVLKSLTFITNRGKYGPFGDEAGAFFSSATTEGKVVGFHGRSGQHLDAIGVHMQHWLGDRRPATKFMLSKYLF